LLEGGKYLDEPKVVGINPFKGITPYTAPLTAAADTGAMLAYQALNNPLAKNVVAPSARAMMLRDYWRKQLEESNRNPYAAIRGVMR
jgi:hypothetical protein